MYSIRLFAILVITFLLCCCEDKKLDLKVIENNEFKVEMYVISEITTAHQFIDITNKRLSKTEKVFEGNAEIDSIYFKNDSIILRTSFLDPIIYEQSYFKFGYKIVIEHLVGDSLIY